ncbi:MAG TPA: phage tail protein [Longimicrobium sp.]|jgi:phage tail-like protein|uniref:phage tail protein n=1 Tax=Longimicrobium sp. TaxID=2029185 RepID=UPI002EDA4FBD
MPDRITPYGAFNFLVNLNGPIGPEEPLGGFSDVSGLGTETTIAEYRNGNDAENHVRKVPGVHKVSDVTLKRGIVSSADLWEWIQNVRRTGPLAQRNVVITLRDETGSDVQSWTLRGVVPLKYTGPTLAAKGGGDVAMEELVLSAEALELNG